jgi:AraC-like DNA-binding protein
MKQALAERVKQAATLLAYPVVAYRTVTDIAYSCGFSDSSHFGRVVAAQMMVTPTSGAGRLPASIEGAQALSRISCSSGSRST